MDPCPFPPVSAIFLEVCTQDTPLQPTIFMQFDELVNEARLARDSLDDRICAQEILHQDSTGVEQRRNALRSSTATAQMTLDFCIPRECTYLDNSIGILEDPSAHWNREFTQINGCGGREGRGDSIWMEMNPASPTQTPAKPCIGL